MRGREKRTDGGGMNTGSVPISALITQYRIMEFPRCRAFAQSFPNTVPFSEGIGFITQVLKPTDVDLTYFETSHELGHQWWDTSLSAAGARAAIRAADAGRHRSLQ
jgi:hypothetical protein